MACGSVYRKSVNTVTTTATTILTLLETQIIIFTAYNHMYIRHSIQGKSVLIFMTTANTLCST